MLYVYRRGNPLFLNPDSYRRLENLWLNHGIEEEIVSRLDYHVSLLAVDWQHL